MSPKALTAFRLRSELLEAMRKVRDEDGIPVTVQMEKAVEAWLKNRGIVVKSPNRRVVARRKG